MSIVAVKAGKLVSYDTVAFVIPVAFVKTVFLTCLNNYLTYCADNSKDPFHKNKDRDVLWLSWYDKPAGVLS